METAFLDRLANQLKANKSATCRRAIQRILVRIKEHCESGQHQRATDAENEFRRLVESDLILQVVGCGDASPQIIGVRIRVPQ